MKSPARLAAPFPFTFAHIPGITLAFQRPATSSPPRFPVPSSINPVPVNEQYLTLKKDLATEADATKTLWVCLMRRLVLTEVRVTQRGCRDLVSASGRHGLKCQFLLKPVRRENEKTLIRTLGWSAAAVRTKMASAHRCYSATKVVALL